MVSKGQMQSAKRLKQARAQKSRFPDLLLKIVNISDIILEVLDARFIKETRNLKIEKMIAKEGKKIIYVLNKADMINVKQIKESLLLEGIQPYVFVSCIQHKGGKELRNKIKAEVKKILIENKNNYERIQVGVIGYPNVGKSSVINLLTGKSSAKTGAEAGFTKGIQKLRLTSNILLLDSPGVIPREEYSMTNSQSISKHAKVGARDYGKIREPEMAVSELINEYKNVFKKFYGIKIEDPEEFIIALGKKKNMLKSKGEVDENRVSRMILKDWQEGKIKIE